MTNPSLFDALQQLRNEPDSRPALEAFLRAVDQHLVHRTRHDGAGSDRHQRALLRVSGAWRQCRAESDRELAAWLATILRRSGPRQSRIQHVPWADVPDLVSDSDPELGVARYTLANLIQEVIARARTLDLAHLPRRARVLARRHHVAATIRGRSRDLGLLMSLRVDGRSATELATELALTPHAVKQGARRGAAWLALVARNMRPANLFAGAALARIAEAFFD